MKGQSGVEYLAMYSIAFMILLVVLAVVYNAFRPPVTAHCDFPLDLYCTDYFIKANGSLTLLIRQNTGHPIVITEFNCTSSDNPTGITSPLPQIIAINSGSQQVVVNGTPCYRQGGDIATGQIGNYYGGKIFLKYNETDTGVVHVLTGNIVARYE